jgi:hypothetical protein
MANLITTVPAIETPTWEVYFKPLLADPRINAMPFNIGIGNMPKDIFFNNNVDKISGAKNGCGWSFKGDMASFTKKTLSPIEIQAPVEQCYTVLLKKLFGDKLPQGAAKGELTPEVIDFMTTQQGYGFNRDLLSMFFLGDTALTPDDYYSLKDGFYKSLLNGVAANDGTVDSGVTIDATTLNPTNFFTTLNNVYKQRSRQLKNMDKSKLVWVWTQAVYELYLDYLEVATQNTAGLVQTNYVLDGITPNVFKGIKIFVPQIVDERLESDFLVGSPALPEDPYRIVLTASDNHIILLDGEQGFQNADVFFEKLEDKVYAVGSTMWDYKYGYGDQNLIAGF